MAEYQQLRKYPQIVIHKVPSLSFCPYILYSLLLSIKILTIRVSVMSLLTLHARYLVRHISISVTDDVLNPYLQNGEISCLLCLLSKEQGLRSITLNCLIEPSNFSSASVCTSLRTVCFSHSYSEILPWVYLGLHLKFLSFLSDFN
jgi:hypothetical protein